MRYEIQRVANITPPDGDDAVFYEVWDVVELDGEERVHRNHDRAFKTEAEAKAWIDQHSD
ncbi:hypothetical protein K7H22_09960 [Seohaeicola saemankumensis]|uniref:hypothetical protein n=1 Tax=Seohaeicola saemankumensis TaxID=481181 RepID=UPI001E374C90|nr:hypothetical protein [Seohaeicola saemankumensis]MCD1626315.1 hypothetical protein [Seohaeicola saemankumensis]